MPLLDQVFISEYLGANKPQLGFFDACFASLPGVKRSESLMLGDSLTSDMLGGKIAGMHTCWYNPNRLPLPTDGHRRIPDPPPTGSAPLAGEAVILHNLQEWNKKQAQAVCLCVFVCLGLEERSWHLDKGAVNWVL